MTGVFLIVRRSLRQHALSTVVTVLAVAMATGLVMGVFSIQAQSKSAFTGGNIGFDAVLGARGSQLQLVLNTVFHLETSPGNIPWSMYQAVKSDSRVKAAIPYALGDNYLGFRIVGTVPALFDGFTFSDGRQYAVQSGGRFFEEGYAEAVIGSFAAQETGLAVGDTFQPYHGLAFNPEAKHEETYTVVGVLEPTNTPNDRVIWIPLEGIYRMSDHVLRGTGEVYVPTAAETIPDAHKEVSAVMLQFRTPIAGASLDATINKQGKEATLAWPIGAVLAEFFQKVGWINRVFELVAYLVVLVSAGAILASIYNTINERRREFAILRALGARRSMVFTAIVAEAAAIAAIGSLFGLLFYGGILALAAVIVRQQTGVVLDVFSLHPSLILTPIGMTLLGALAGVVPAVKAYATDVADNLVPHS
jgi:putative ABC transport system permease protein